jgi:hypothetical protein
MARKNSGAEKRRTLTVVYTIRAIKQLDEIWDRKGNMTVKRRILLLLRDIEHA